MKRLYRNHQWISQPDSKGLSYFGISPFAKEYFTRLKRLDFEEFFKIKYGMNYKLKNQLFLERIRRKPWQQMQTSEKIEYDRFAIRQDEVFCKLLTAEFDIQLTAPAQMRVLNQNFKTYYDQQIYQEEWILRVQVLRKQQLQFLLTEQEYENQKKYIPYV